jgi:hypothetical protein
MSHVVPILFPNARKPSHVFDVHLFFPEPTP